MLSDLSTNTGPFNSTKEFGFRLDVPLDQGLVKDAKKTTPALRRSKRHMCLKLQQNLVEYLQTDLF